MPIQVVATKGGQQVVVTLDGTKTTVETKGFAGRACLDATVALEQALGVKTADTPTPEMSQAQPQRTGVKQ